MSESKTVVKSKSEIVENYFQDLEKYALEHLEEGRKNPTEYKMEFEEGSSLIYVFLKFKKVYNFGLFKIPLWFYVPNPIIKKRPSLYEIPYIADELYEVTDHTRGISHMHHICKILGDKLYRLDFLKTEVVFSNQQEIRIFKESLFNKFTEEFIDKFPNIDVYFEFHKKLKKQENLNKSVLNVKSP